MYTKTTNRIYLKSGPLTSLTCSSYGQVMNLNLFGISIKWSLQRGSPFKNVALYTGFFVFHFTIYHLHSKYQPMFPFFHQGLQISSVLQSDTAFQLLAFVSWIDQAVWRYLPANIINSNIIAKLYKINFKNLNFCCCCY